MNTMQPKNPHAVALGSIGGRSKSPAKVAAAKENGKLGGRPPKTQPVITNDQK